MESRFRWRTQVGKEVASASSDHTEGPNRLPPGQSLGVGNKRRALAAPDEEGEPSRTFSFQNAGSLKDDIAREIQRVHQVAFGKDTGIPEPLTDVYFG